MSQVIAMDDGASVALARRAVRLLGDRHQVAEHEVERAAIVVSELAHNQLRHARLGEVTLAPITRGEHRGIEITAVDAGDGLADPVEAFAGVPKAEGPGLGIGLAGVRRLATELDVESRTLEGVRIRARILPEHTRAGPSVVLFGRPHPEESLSGDDAAIVRTETHLTLILADGLGHGPEARKAATIACRCCTQHADLRPDQALRECDLSLRGSRGSAVAVVSVNLQTDAVSASIAGNVRVGLYGPDGGQRVPYTPSVLGRGRGRPPQLSTFPRRGRTLVLFTDGLPDRTDPSLDRAGLLGWPLGLAWRLLDRHHNGRDDATVLAMR
ncbi:MAG: hypothetical protein EA397_07570 [Deltaproteobacteria bacterium]|nr:MAG: hypothetical protein EA397_07570 [Deltaproteobacteria bacterium]